MRYMYNFKYDGRENLFLDYFYALKSSISRHLPSMMLDDTRCGLDASSLHRDASMYNYKVEKSKLLSCHRDTLSTTRYKTK